MRQKVKDMIANNKLKGATPLLSKPIRIRKVKDAKRLLAKLIYGLQTGEINSQHAKDITYLLTSYVNIATVTDFEERLKKLEQQAK